MKATVEMCQMLKAENTKLKNHIETIQVQIFQKNIPSMFLNPKNLFYFPDPHFEFHPDHRKWGAYGEDLLRQGFKNVIFYNINMQAPYMHEVKDFKGTIISNWIESVQDLSILNAMIQDTTLMPVERKLKVLNYSPVFWNWDINDIGIKIFF